MEIGHLLSKHPPQGFPEWEKMESRKVAICDESLVVKWIEEIKRNILSPFPGDRGNSLGSYSTKFFRRGNIAPYFPKYGTYGHEKFA